MLRTINISSRIIFLLWIYLDCASSHNNKKFLPEMFHLESYDECLALKQKYRTTAYCLADVYIKPNTSSELWHIIEETSRPRKTQFRHDHLVYGLCMSNCRKTMGKFDKMTQKKYFMASSKNFSEFKSPNHLDFRYEIEDDMEYGELMNECINFELQRKYQLMAYSQIQYCDIKERFEEFDNLDTIFITLIILVTTLFTIGTSYDIISQQTSHAKYLPSWLHNFFQSFSIRFNYLWMFKEHKSQELDFIHSIKFLMMALIILGHCILLHSVLPFSNPEFIESKFKQTLPMIILNGTIAIQTFFTLTGFLLAIRCAEYFDRAKNFNVGTVVTAMIYRFLRLVPLYSIIIMFDATLLIRLSDGPVWRRLNEPTKHFCRKNFWTNLLFLNNYIYPDEPCVQQGWYLAVDFQMCIIGTILILTMTRFPGYRKPLMTFCLITPPLLVALTTYVNNFDGVFIASPEQQRHMFWDDKMYREYHIATHTNADGFITGAIVGYYYKEIKSMMIKSLMCSKFFQVTCYLTILMGILLLISAKIFYVFEFGKPSIIVALYAVLTKKLWGILVMVFILGCDIDRENLISRILLSKYLINLGKLTYTAYLIHLDVTKILYGNTRQPYNLSILKLIETFLTTLCTTYFISLLLHLMIEVPSSICRIKLFKKGQK